MSTVKQFPHLLNPAQRIGELLITFALLLLTGFFVIHQLSKTGFFTSRFGIVEMALLYAPLLLGVVAAVMKVLTGELHSAQPFQVLSNSLLGVAALWLLIVFPFDFSHLADALPESLRFLLTWVTNDLGKIPLVIQLFVGPATAFVTIRDYFSRP